MLYEIRNYWYDPAHFEEYVEWGREIAAPYFRSIMDVVGLWAMNDMSPIYGGSQPRDDNMVPANFTWMIRWKSRAHREEVWEEARQSAEWTRVFSLRPGRPEHYLRTEVKFAEAI
jgi:hypothetical protein